MLSYKELVDLNNFFATNLSGVTLIQQKEDQFTNSLVYTFEIYYYLTKEKETIEIYISKWEIVRTKLIVSEYIKDNLYFYLEHYFKNSYDRKIVRVAHPKSTAPNVGPLKIIDPKIMSIQNTTNEIMSEVSNILEELTND